MHIYDARTAAAWTQWLSTIPQGMHEGARLTMDDAADLANARWKSFCEGKQPTTDSDTNDNSPTIATYGSFIPAVGMEDIDHPLRRQRLGAIQLQQQLTKMADNCVATGLGQRLSLIHN